MYVNTVCEDKPLFKFHCLPNVAGQIWKISEKASDGSLRWIHFQMPFTDKGEYTVTDSLLSSVDAEL